MAMPLCLSKGQYKKAIASLHHLAALQGSLSQPQITGQGTLEHQRALIQLATCHFALGEYRVSTGKLMWRRYQRLQSTLGHLSPIVGFQVNVSLSLTLPLRPVT